MANNNGCGCSRRGGRYSNTYGCLNSVGGRYRWENYPYYNGPCPDVEGDYDDDRDDDRDDNRDDRDNGRRGGRKQRRNGDNFGIFSAMLPIAVAANGIIPLANTGCLGHKNGFPVNSGLITIKEEGTYLATYTVRIPPDTSVDTTITLNVNDASQTSAIAIIDTDGESDHTFSVTAQAIFEADRGDTVTLRSSDSININDTSVQPLFTLSLVQLDDD